MTQGPPEKRMLREMGATIDDLDIGTTPLLSSEDFMNRCAGWMRDVEGSVGRDRAMIVYGAKGKELVGASNVNWDRVVAGSCQS
jgi:hypothetical protein